MLGLGIKSRGEKDTTVIISFVGDKASDITLFITKLLSNDNQVLLVDLSVQKRLFINAVGNEEESTVTYRRICFTVSEEFYNNHGYEYDYIILYCDDSREFPAIVYEANHLFFCFGMQRYSLYLMERAFSISDLESPHSIVFRGINDNKRMRQAEDIYNLMTAKKVKADNIFYVPICESDLAELYHLEFDGLNIMNLSCAMQNLIMEVLSKVGHEHDIPKELCSQV